MGFSTYWNHADAVSRTLYFVLLAMSIATWTIFIIRLIGTKQIKQEAKARVEQALRKVQARMKGIPVAQHRAIAEEALTQQIKREKNATSRGMSVLGTIASIAPFVGLFGTVWGIFHALVAIGDKGQAGLAQVAAPVGEALIMTGFGLAVAIPAVLAYNICLRQGRSVGVELHDYAHTLIIDMMLAEPVQAEKVETKTAQTQYAGGQA